jgi:hypothetical protein
VGEAQAQTVAELAGHGKQRAGGDHQPCLKTISKGWRLYRYRQVFA